MLLVAYFCVYTTKRWSFVYPKHILCIYYEVVLYRQAPMFGWMLFIFVEEFRKQFISGSIKVQIFIIYKELYIKSHIRSEFDLYFKPCSLIVQTLGINGNINETP